MTQVSVIVPTFNGAGYVREALQSIAVQTLRPQQIIVVDDQSSDATCEVVEEFARDSEIQVRLERLTKNSGGPAAPLNTGVALAKQDFCAVLEQDDVMHPLRLQEQITALRAYPDCGLSLGRRVVFSTGQRDLDWSSWHGSVDEKSFPTFDGARTRLESRDAFRHMLRHSFTHSNSNFTFRREAWTRVGGFDPRWPRNSDIDFALRMILSAPIAVVSQPTFGYRVHGDSLWHASTARGVVDGYLIRLEACQRRPDWAGPHLHALLWALSRELGRALRRRDFLLSHKITAALVKGGVLRRYVVPKLLGRGTASVGQAS